MRQVLLDKRSGEIRVVDVPAPRAGAGGVLVATRASLISSGTERSTIRLGERSLIGKARARPDQVKKVLSALRQKGLKETMRTVQARLAEPTALGYSAAGDVLAVGEGAEEFSPGDRVACAGAGFASHAEMSFVPRNLVVRLPENVAYDAGSFVALGAIALHGIRTARVELGDHVAVIGLGLVGLLAVQQLRAAGCTVYGFDPSTSRARLARDLAADLSFSASEELAAAIRAHTGGRGADVVLVTAATASDEPVQLAGELARDRGSVCVVGDVGLRLPRAPYYEKELAFRISRSYGPGRYDPAYELFGQDYPAGFVPWDERRNMEAFLDLVSRRQVRIDPLISARHGIEDAVSAYERVKEGDAIGIVLTYPGAERREPTRAVSVSPLERPKGTALGIAVIGAGDFARSTLLPRLARHPEAKLKAIVTSSGGSARSAAEEFEAAMAVTDPRVVLEDPEIGIVVIITRHDSHAGLAEAALRAGKAVFVEKPLAIELGELRRLQSAIEESGNDRLMVGFNRRFSDYVTRLRERFGGVPLAMVYRVNAGPLPAEHWTRLRDVGGGRIIGEGCHFVDTMTFLTGSPVTQVHAHAVPPADRGSADTVQINLRYENGSVGHIAYMATGDPAMGKERLEVFGGGRSAILDNYKRLVIWSGGKRRRSRSRLSVDKGFDREVAVFLDACVGGSTMPITIAELVNTTEATFAIERSLAEGRSITLEELE